MKKSPIVTLLVGVLLAAVIAVLSVRAHEAGTAPRPTPTGSTNQTYGLGANVNVAWTR
jgi:hypothetical protein